ncbi:MAG: hypothetical protein WCK77_01005 [Verrucomicrobiota bacterium]
MFKYPKPGTGQHWAEKVAAEIAKATDSFEVFPKIETLEDGSFRCRFFLHGWRHVNPEAKQRLNTLVTGV